MIRDLLYNRILMAIRDSNVLNRVNTLNTNLENNNVAEIERNVWTSLFNVLEGPMNISIDPEILASIEQTSDTSDLGRRINTQRWRLPTAPIDIPYPTWSVNVANTVVTRTTTNNAWETQLRINENQWYIDSLRNDLPNQIRVLRGRLEENQRIVNDINRTQCELPARLRAARTINTDITNLQNLSNSVQQLNDLLRRINDIERDRDYWAGNRRATNLDNQRTTIISNFNTIYGGVAFPHGISPAGIPSTFWAWDSAVVFMWYFRTISTNISSRLSELRNQLSWIQNIEDLTDSLPTDRVWVPSYSLGFWDWETVVNHTNITTATGSSTELDRIKERLRNLQVLEDNIPRLHDRYQKNIDTLNRLLILQKLSERLQSRYPWEIDRRHDEFNLIRDISINNLWLRNAWYQSRLPNQTFNIGQTVAPIPLDFIHWTLRAGLTPTYSLCDTSWNPYRIDGWNIEIPLENWTTVRLSWITFSPAWEMVINNLRVTPLDWITLPLNLNNLNVRVRIHDDATWLDIDHHKPIHIEVTGPTLTQAIRENAYDSLRPPMGQRIEAEYSDNYRENLENEAIWRILREWWNEAEVNEIYNDEARRNLLQDRMRRLLHRYFPANALVLNDLQTSFRTRMTTRNDVPVQYLLNEVTFTDYIRNSIPNRLREHASWRIYNQINTAIRTNILREFLDFQTDIVNNRVDNTDNLRLLAQIPADASWPQGHPNSWRQRLRWRRSRKNNYTKFLEWRAASLDNQTLETEDWEIRYWVNVEVAWVNRIVATINIDWKEEPEIIEAANHDRLIRGILNRASTKDWEPLNIKLRCNIALSVLKAMVMISPQRLSREIPPRNFMDNRWNIVRCNRVEAFIRWNNLTIRWGMVDPATRTRQNATIFDENLFRSWYDIDSLENCVRELSTQINSIMNATAQEYQNATNWLLHNRENRNLLKYDTKQWLRWGPIKRLRWRLAHGKTNSDFNFETSVNEDWKTVNIAFNNWKFNVSWEFDWQEYNYESKDLWSILRKKINRKRVFDWIELAMVARINEEYVERLRTNNLIQTENFAVSDLNNNKSWRVYLFDEWGNLSYLEIEDRALNPLRWRIAWRIDADAIPTERIRCNNQERREFFQNPLLAWRLLREMKRWLALF